MGHNHEVLERFFPAMFSKDRQTLRALFTDDIVWHLPPFAQAQFEEPKGSENVVGFLCDEGATFYEPGSFQLQPEVQAVEGDQAIVLGWMTARTANGNAYENRYAFGFRFREGRISDVWELLDTAHFAAQME